MPKILDVGCGLNKRPGAVGMDNNPKTAADVIHDCGVVPYPFPDDEFDEVFAIHVAEHVPDVMMFIKELHRVTRPGGIIKLVSPHYTNPDWPTDPTHRNHFNSYSFRYFYEGEQSFPFYTDVYLKPLIVRVTLANLWRGLGIEWLVNLDNRHAALRVIRKFWEQYLSPVMRGKDLYFEFEVIKKPRSAA